MARQYVLVQLHDKGKISVPENSPTHLKAMKQIQGWHVVGEPYNPQMSGPGGQPQKKSPAAVERVTNRPAAERAVGKGQRLGEAIPVPPFDSSKVLEPIRSPKRFENAESPAANETKGTDNGTAELQVSNENISAANEKTPIDPSKGKPGPKPKIK